MPKPDPKTNNASTVKVDPKANPDPALTAGQAYAAQRQPHNEFIGINLFDGKSDEFKNMVLTSDTVRLEKFIKDNDELLTNDPNKLTVREKKYLQLRLDSQKKINELEGKKKEYNYVLKAPEDVDKNDLKRLPIVRTKCQSTNNGCWSVSLMLLLQAMGIELKQEEIRSFRPDFTEEDRKNIIKNKDISDESDWKILNQDRASNVYQMSDIVLKTVPNTGIMRIKYADPYDENQIRTEVAEVVDDAVNNRHVPVSILFGGHYRTITGIATLGDNKYVYVEDSQISPQNPDEKNQGWVSLDYFLQKASPLEISWLVPLTVKENGAVEGLPKDFAGLGYEKGKLIPGNYYNPDTTGPFQKSGNAYAKNGMGKAGRWVSFVPPVQLSSPYIDRQTGKDNPAKGKKVQIEYDEALIFKSFNVVRNDVHQSKEGQVTFFDDAKKYLSGKDVAELIKNGTAFQKELCRFMSIYSRQEIVDDIKDARGYARFYEDVMHLEKVADKNIAEADELYGIMSKVHDMSGRLTELWNAGVKIKTFSDDRLYITEPNAGDELFYIGQMTNKENKTAEQLDVERAEYVASHFDDYNGIINEIRKEKRPTFEQMENGVKAIFNARYQAVLKTLGISEKKAEKASPEIKNVINDARRRDAESFAGNREIVITYLEYLKHDTAFSKCEWSNDAWEANRNLLKEAYSYSLDPMDNAFGLLKKSGFCGDIDVDKAINDKDYKKLMDRYVSYMSEPELMNTYLEFSTGIEKEERDLFRLGHGTWDVYELMAGNFNMVLKSIPEEIRKTYDAEKLEALSEYCKKVSENRKVFLENADYFNDQHGGVNSKLYKKDRHEKNRAERNGALSTAISRLKLLEYIPDAVENKGIVNITEAEPGLLPTEQIKGVISDFVKKYIKSLDVSKALQNKFNEYHLKFSKLRGEILTQKADARQLDEMIKAGKELDKELQKIEGNKQLTGGEKLYRKIKSAVAMDREILYQALAKTAKHETFAGQIISAKKALMRLEKNNSQKQMLKKEENTYKEKVSAEINKIIPDLEKTMEGIDRKYWRYVNIFAAQIEVLHINEGEGTYYPSFDSGKMQNVENVLYDVTKNRPGSYKDFYDAMRKIYNAAEIFVNSRKNKSLSGEKKKQYEFCVRLRNMSVEALVGMKDIINKAQCCQESFNIFKEKLWEVQKHPEAQKADYFTWSRAKAERDSLKAEITDLNNEFSAETYARYYILNNIIKNKRTHELSRLTKVELDCRVSDMLVENGIELRNMEGFVDRGELDRTSIKELDRNFKSFKEQIAQRRRQQEEEMKQWEAMRAARIQAQKQGHGPQILPQN